MGLESRPGGEMVGTPCGGRGWRRGKRPRKPSVRSPGRDWATCRARHRCQVSGRAWGERGRAGWGKHWPAPGRSRLLPTVRREEHVDHAPPMCGRMARATRPRMRGTGAGDGGSRGDGAGGKLGASGGRVTGRSPGCEQAALPHWPCWSADLVPTRAATSKAVETVANFVPASSISVNS